MKALTISEAFHEAIAGREVLQAFFTTYSFEPDFFELEVLPLMLGNPTLSSNETIRYYQLQSLMRQHVGRLAVAYDVGVFDPQLAPRLEVDYLPVRIGGACQHAKLAVLVVREHKSQRKSIVLCAGSFNLTKAGWWENLEVGHWVELNESSAPGNILRPLHEALRFFQRKVPTPVLDALLVTAKNLQATEDDPNCRFYFSGTGTARNHFDTFITEHASVDDALEVISPFFSVEADNRIILDFLKPYPKTTVLLPVDDQGLALVDQKSVYEALPRDTVVWGQWSKKIRSSHLDPKAPYRRLHAKIYRSAGLTPWCFVGSVNLSFKAFRQNVEAGFLLKGLSAKPLLEPLAVTPDKFKVEEDASTSSELGAREMPVICLVFDWQNDLLQASCVSSGELRLLNSTNEPIVTMTLEGGQDCSSAVPQLKEHLQRSSLVQACWQSNAEQSLKGTLLISQRNLFCRPSSLPALGLQELLRIFIGLHEARRLDLISGLAIRLLHSNQDDGLQDEFLPELGEQHVRENFFAEFSQVNGAFWELARRLKKAECEGDLQVLAYYLKGLQPDSLSKVVDSIVALDATTQPASLVVRYLTLLSIADLLRRFSSHTDGCLLLRVEKGLSILERDELLTQPQLSGDEGERFLLWFKQKFYQSVLEITRCNDKEGR